MMMAHKAPVRVPVVEGVKVIWMEQEALGARVWVQWEPVALVTRVKSPVAVLVLMVMGEGVALVRVKLEGALVLATGPGAEVRRAMGVAVFAGMLGVTVFGLILTPVFYVVVQGLAEKVSRRTPTVAPQVPAIAESH